MRAALAHATFREASAQNEVFLQEGNTFEDCYYPTLLHLECAAAFYSQVAIQETTRDPKKDLEIRPLNPRAGLLVGHYTVKRGFCVWKANSGGTASPKFCV